MTPPRHLFIMRAIAVVAALLFAGIVSTPRAGATIVGTGLIGQPAYLGDASQPDRIPLAPVIYNANHGYGSHTAIFQSRPCYHGYFKGANGKPEYEQNLAVLFGISCELSDTTQMPGCTATFRIRSASPPPNAPYTQEQVFAASLQALLLRSWGMSREYPLTVVVEGEGIPKPSWTKKYEGPYFYQDEELKNRSDLKTLPVPGIGIDDTTVPGVIYLVLEGVAPDPRIKERRPVFVPFTREGESDNGGAVFLIPVWHGDTWDHPLGVIARPLLPYYEKWHGSSSGGFTETEAVPHLTPPNPVVVAERFCLDDGETGDQARVAYGDMSPDQLAVLAFACVATARPTEDHPFTLNLDKVSLPEVYQEQLRSDSAWKDGATCAFAIDPVTMKLRQGSVPGYEMTCQYGQLVVSMVEAKEKMFYEEDPAPPWVAATLEQIKSTIPSVTPGQFEEVTKGYREKLGAEDPKHPVSREEKIRIMLAIWLHGDRPEVFEALWWRSHDRVTRALAACLATRCARPGDTARPADYSHWLTAERFSAWECGQRTEELGSMLQYRLAAAVAEWRKRGEEPPAVGE